MLNKTQLKKTVTGVIADPAKGHIDFTGTITEAVDTIIRQAKEFGKWVYFDGDLFNFTGSYDKAEKEKLSEALFGMESFHIAGKLIGG